MTETPQRAYGWASHAVKPKFQPCHSLPACTERIEPGAALCRQIFENLPNSTRHVVCNAEHLKGHQRFDACNALLESGAGVPPNSLLSHPRGATIEKSRALRVALVMCAMRTPLSALARQHKSLFESVGQQAYLHLGTISIFCPNTDMLDALTLKKENINRYCFYLRMTTANKY